MARAKVLTGKTDQGGERRARVQAPEVENQGEEALKSIQHVWYGHDP